MFRDTLDHGLPPCKHCGRSAVIYMEDGVYHIGCDDALDCPGNLNQVANIHANLKEGLDMWARENRAESNTDVR